MNIFKIFQAYTIMRVAVEKIGIFLAVEMCKGPIGEFFSSLRCNVWKLQRYSSTWKKPTQIFTSPNKNMCFYRSRNNGGFCWSRPRRQLGELFPSLRGRATCSSFRKTFLRREKSYLDFFKSIHSCVWLSEQKILNFFEKGARRPLRWIFFSAGRLSNV